jgi:hypothetical protein
VSPWRASSPSSSVVVRDSPAALLRLRALPLCIHAALDGLSRRPGLATASRDDSGAANQLSEPLARIVAILRLRPVTPGFDDDYAVRCDAAAGE